MENKSTKIQCKFCGYPWVTASKLIMVSCPSCMKKNYNLNSEVNKDEKPNKVAGVEDKESNTRPNSDIPNPIKMQQEGFKTLPEVCDIEDDD